MTDAVASPAAPPNRRRWLVVLLVASLAINALLVGVILRSLWAVRANLAVTGGGIERGLPAFVSTLPANRREALRPRDAVAQPGTLRPLRTELRQARFEAARAFVADPFDKQAFIAAQKRLFDAESELRLAIQRALPEIGERMTASERRAYLHWRGHRFGGFRRGGGSRGGDGDRDDAGGPPGPGSGPGR